MTAVEEVIASEGTLLGVGLSATTVADVEVVLGTVDDASVEFGDSDSSNDAVAGAVDSCCNGCART